MKTLIFTYIIVSLSISSALSQDFRQITWGMDRAEIEAAEGKRATVINTDQLGYEVTVAGMSAILAYMMLDGKVVGAGYSFNHSHSELSNYIRDFNRLKGIIRRNSGTPTHDKETWVNELLKGDPSHLSTALGLGHVSYETQWLTDRSEIKLTLTGNGMKANLLVLYISKEHKNALIRRQRQSEAADF